MLPTLHLKSGLAAPRTSSGHQSAAARAGSFISLMTNWSWIVLVVAASYQILFFPDYPNLVVVGGIGLGWLLFAKIFLRPAMFRDYPFSTFLILGFTTTQLYFPLLFTSLEAKPVINNLLLPHEVFLHIGAALLVLVVTHAIYRALSPPATAPSSSAVLVRLGFFTPPSDLQLWLMGFIGLAATFYVYLFAPSIGQEVTGNASDKAVQALLPFSYAPFFIPFGYLYGKGQPAGRKIVPMLVLYTLLLFLVSIGRNSRAGFMIGFTSVGFAYSLGLLLGVFEARFFTLKNGFIALGALWLFTGPVADIGTAMVIVRTQRRDTPYPGLIANTLAAFNDKEAIAQYKLFDAEQNESGDWDERYLNNIFLARFCNVKFNDMSLVQAAKLGGQSPTLLKFSRDYAWATLPQPVLDALGVSDVDKVMVKGVSFGDYIFFTAGAPSDVLGGYRTGHFAGTGMATFGWWYLLLLGIGMLPVYLLMDKFRLAVRPPHQPRGPAQLRFSLCGLLALDFVFRFMHTESVVNIVAFLVRDWLQLVVLYFVVYHFTRLLGRIFGASVAPLSR